MNGDFMGLPLFLGVDGGGTKCRARLADARGRTLGEGLGGPANIWRDAVQAMGSVREACRSAVRAAGLPDTALAQAHAGLGLAGAGQQSAVERFSALPHPFASMTVETDAYAAWLGAFGGADGGIVIVGTGSCGYAVVRGVATYVGGFGAEISDEGSGAAIGREAIRRALWAQDGRAPMSGLAAALLAQFPGGREPIIEWAKAAGPLDLARFAPLVFEHARAGDPLGRALLTEAATEIARIAERLLAVGAPALAMLGGLAEPLRPWLPEALAARLVAPRADAMEGAILLARRAQAERETQARKRA
jgi:glucosamine kinase